MSPKCWQTPCHRREGVCQSFEHLQEAQKTLKMIFLKEIWKRTSKICGLLQCVQNVKKHPLANKKVVWQHLKFIRKPRENQRIYVIYKKQWKNKGKLEPNKMCWEHPLVDEHVNCCGHFTKAPRKSRMDIPYRILIKVENLWPIAMCSKCGKTPFGRGEDVLAHL